MKHAMTSRERVLTALRHEEPDRIPISIPYETPESLLARYGKSGEGIPIRQDTSEPWMCWPAPPADARERWFADADVPADAVFDAFGVARWHGAEGLSHGILGPLRNATTVEEIDAFPWPKPLLDENYTGAIEAARRAGQAVIGNAGSLFEHAWYLFGMENFLEALCGEPELTEALIEHLAAIYVPHARALAEADVDIIAVHDDIAGQLGMMVSPATWRRLIKPRFAAIIEAARGVKPGMPVFYHSDGNLSAVIDELIEIGVTILNPVQPEAIDPFEVKKRYGGRLTIWGGVGTQSVLPHGSPEDVRRTVLEYCKVLGTGGGFVIGPTHAIKEDVPWANIEAFYRAVEEFGN